LLNALQTNTTLITLRLYDTFDTIYCFLNSDSLDNNTIEKVIVDGIDKSLLRNNIQRYKTIVESAVEEIK
jgi:hypothetical protein